MGKIAQKIREKRISRACELINYYMRRPKKLTEQDAEKLVELVKKSKCAGLIDKFAICIGNHDLISREHRLALASALCELPNEQLSSYNILDVVGAFKDLSTPIFKQVAEKYAQVSFSYRITYFFDEFKDRLDADTQSMLVDYMVSPAMEEERSLTMEVCAKHVIKYKNLPEPAKMKLVNAVLDFGSPSLCKDVLKGVENLPEDVKGRLEEAASKEEFVPAYLDDCLDDSDETRV